MQILVFIALIGYRKYVQLPSILINNDTVGTLENLFAHTSSHFPTVA